MNFDPNQIAQKLTASIRLSLPPIAICFTDKVPAGIADLDGARSRGLPVLAGSGNQSVCHILE